MQQSSMAAFVVARGFLHRKEKDYQEQSENNVLELVNTS